MSSSKRDILEVKIESLCGLLELLSDHGNLAVTYTLLHCFANKKIFSTFKFLESFLCVSRIFKADKSKAFRLAFIVNHH